MRRAWGPSGDELVDWEPASLRHPCPCCGATGGCAVAVRAGYVCCRSVPAARPIEGGGWLHVLAGEAAASAGG
jgi:hypothetical protein